MSVRLTLDREAASAKDVNHPEMERSNTPLEQSFFRETNNLHPLRWDSSYTTIQTKN